MDATFFEETRYPTQSGESVKDSERRVGYKLLWYMPYSKFAHMIYRSLAIVHTKQVGREGR